MDSQLEQNIFCTKTMVFISIQSSNFQQFDARGFWTKIINFSNIHVSIINNDAPMICCYNAFKSIFFLLKKGSRYNLIRERILFFDSIFNTYLYTGATLYISYKAVIGKFVSTISYTTFAFLISWSVDNRKIRKQSSVSWTQLHFRHTSSLIPEFAISCSSD